VSKITEPVYSLYVYPAKHVSYFPRRILTSLHRAQPINT